MNGRSERGAAANAVAPGHGSSPLLDANNVRAAAPKANGREVVPADLEPALPSGDDGRINFRVVWTLTSMSLGIGLFAIPSAFLKLGAAQGAIWVVLMGCAANFAQQRLLDVAAEHSLTSYEDLAEKAFGRIGRLSIMVIILVTTFIASVSYMGSSRQLLLSVIVSFLLEVDTVEPGSNIEVLGFTKNNVVLVVLTAAVMPLCVSNTMTEKAWISKAGVFCMGGAAILFMGFCAAVLIRGCHGPHDQCGDRAPMMTTDVGDIFQYTATLAFSFSMIFALLPTMSESMQNGDVDVQQAAKLTKRNIQCSVGLSCGLYVLIGLVGVLTYGSFMQSLGLDNLPMVEPLPQMIVCMAGVISALLVPIVSFPTVGALETFARMCLRRPDWNIRPGIVALLGCLIVLVDAFVPTHIAFQLTGSLGLAMAAYIMPCLLFLRLDSRHSCGNWRKILASVVLAFGLLLFFGSTPITVYRMLQGGGDDGQAVSLLHWLKQELC